MIQSVRKLLPGTGKKQQPHFIVQSMQQLLSERVNLITVNETYTLVSHETKHHIYTYANDRLRTDPAIVMPAPEMRPPTTAADVLLAVCFTATLS